MTQLQHTFRLPPRTVKEYARQLLEALYQRDGNGRRSGFEQFAPALTMRVIYKWRHRDDGTARTAALGYGDLIG